MCYGISESEVHDKTKGRSDAPLDGAHEMNQLRNFILLDTVFSFSFSTRPFH